MTPFSALIASLQQADGDAPWRAHIPADWQQGRTTFGGLTAALCLAAVQRGFGDDLPPLRAAQFIFCGPAGGDVEIRTAALRRGKSSLFASADLHAGGSLATRASFSFAAARSSTINHRSLPIPDVPPPAQALPFFRDHPGPVFMQHFDTRRAGGALPVSAAADPDILIWMRHKDAQAMASLAGLVALGDGPPPAALCMFASPAPISTMSWGIEIIDAAAAMAAGDAWFLLRSTADDARDGYSTQDMTLWHEDGRLVARGRQSIAIFA